MDNPVSALYVIHKPFSEETFEQKSSLKAVLNCFKTLLFLWSARLSDASNQLFSNLTEVKFPIINQIFNCRYQLYYGFDREKLILFKKSHISYLFIFIAIKNSLLYLQRREQYCCAIILQHIPLPDSRLQRLQSRHPLRKSSY